MEKNNGDLVNMVKEEIKELTIQQDDKKIDESMLKEEAQRQGDELQYDSIMDLVDDSPEVFLKKELFEGSWEKNCLIILI